MRTSMHLLFAHPPKRKRKHNPNYLRDLCALGFAVIAGMLLIIAGIGVL